MAEVMERNKAAKRKKGSLLFLISVIVIIICIFLVLFTGQKKHHTTDHILRVGIAVYNLDDAYIAEMTGKLEDHLMAYFKDRDVTLQYEILDAENSESRQAKQLDYLIKQDMDILVLNLVNPSAGAQIMSRANNCSTPVVLFNREPNREDLDIGEQIWYVGADGKAAGSLQGAMLTSAWEKDRAGIDRNHNGKIDYILVEGESSHYDTIRRTNAFLESTQGMLPLKQLADFSADWNQSEAYQGLAVMDAATVQSAEAVICNNDDMALGVYQYYAGQGYPLPVILGINDKQDVHELVTQGKIYGTVNQNYEEQVSILTQIIGKICEKDPVEQKIWYSSSEIYDGGKNTQAENVEN